VPQPGRGTTSAVFSSDQSSSVLSKDASRTNAREDDNGVSIAGPKIERLSMMFKEIMKKKS
jgi:hypothetical protein